MKNLKKGDQVFGIGSDTFGAYAEYVCRPESGALVLKPSNLSYEEAATIPFGAGTAVITSYSIHYTKLYETAELYRGIGDLYRQRGELEAAVEHMAKAREVGEKGSYNFV